MEVECNGGSLKVNQFAEGKQESQLNFESLGNATEEGGIDFMCKAAGWAGISHKKDKFFYGKKLVFPTQYRERREFSYHPNALIYWLVPKRYSCSEVITAVINYRTRIRSVDVTVPGQEPRQGVIGNGRE